MKKIILIISFLIIFLTFNSVSARTSIRPEPLDLWGEIKALKTQIAGFINSLTNQDERINTLEERVAFLESLILPPEDTIAPVINNIQTYNNSATATRISWYTNEDSDSLVYYDFATSPEYAHSIVGNTYFNGAQFVHETNLTNLIPNTTYKYIISSTDIHNNTSTSTPRNFTTDAEYQAPILNATVANNTPSSDIIIAGTNVLLGNWTFNCIGLEDCALRNVTFKIYDDSSNDNGNGYGYFDMNDLLDSDIITNLELREGNNIIDNTINNNGTAYFDNDYYIQSGENITLSLYGDVNNNFTNMTSGDVNNFVLNHYSCIGTNTAESCNSINDLNLATNQLMQVRKTRVSVTNQNVNNNLINGLQTIMSVNITADSAGEANLNKLSYEIQSDGVSINSIFLYHNNNLIASSTNSNDFFNLFSPNNIIAAGDIENYNLKINASNVNAGDYVSMRILGDNDFIWSDGEDSNINGKFINNLPSTWSTLSSS